MTRDLAYRVGLCFFLILQDCAAPHQSGPTANSVRPVGDNGLLAELKRCLTEVDTHNNEHFISPCVRMNVARLSGISIAQLEAALGRPGISSDDYVSVPDHPNPGAQKQPYEARWGFYKYPIDSVTVTVGGGPELQCVSPDGVTCKQVLWVHTQ